MKLNKRAIFLLCILFFWISIIFSLSAQNGEQTTNLSYTLTLEVVSIFYDEAPQHIIDNAHAFVRTLAHVSLFAILGSLSALISSIYLSPKTAFLVSTALSFFIGFFDEWKKQFISGRHFDGGEVILNLISSFVSILVVLFIVSKLKKMNNNKKTL